MSVSLSSKERKKAAAKVQKSAENVISKEICDNCAHGTWATQQWNLDLNGKPLTIRCPFYEDGKFGILRGTKACSHFKNK